MVDLKSVVIQVKQGNYPSDWQVYNGEGNYNYVLLCWVFIAGTLITGVGLTSYALSHTGFDNAITTFLVTLSLTGLLIALARRLKLKADDKEHAILVVLPQAVVQCNSVDLKEISWLYFQGIERIELAQETEIVGMDGDISSRTYSWLDVYNSNGTYIKWWIGDWFGDTASIGKAIIASYGYYSR